MNYCTKCESYYQKPGTCNCYASAQPAWITAPLPWQPSTTIPWPSAWPIIGPTITYGIGAAVTANTASGYFGGHQQ